MQQKKWIYFKKEPFIFYFQKYNNFWYVWFMDNGIFLALDTETVFFSNHFALP